MEHARNVLREAVGNEKEAQIYRMHCDDFDAYCNAAVQAPEAGLVCPACKQNTAAIELLQTRSADEGMTAYIVCQSCSYRRTYS